jgi:hypothetical protein
MCGEQIRRVERFVYDVLIAPRHLNRVAPVFGYQPSERHAVLFHDVANPNVICPVTKIRTFNEPHRVR